MTNRIYDEKNRLFYEQQRDYFIPCLKLPKDENKSIGVWGQRHLQHIKQHRKSFYTVLLLSGNLHKYLADIDLQSKEKFLLLIKQLAEQEQITENLKAENPMLWVQKMNNVRNIATEIVNSEVIFD